LEKAVTKVQAVFLLAILLIGAFGAYYIAQRETPKRSNSSTFTPAPITSLTPTTKAAPTPTQIATPTLTPIATSAPVKAAVLPVVPVSVLQPYNPGGPNNPPGPTIVVTLQNNSTSPVVSLQVVLTLSGQNFTYIFNNVSENSPLFPNQDTSQTQVLTAAVFETNQIYPMLITGALQNGTTFDSATSTKIIQSNQLMGTGTQGNLQLTMSIDKTAYNVDEPVNIILTITNISNQTIDFTHTGLDFDFKVTNDTNNIVYQWSNFKAIPQFITIESVGAGDSISSNFTWGQTCNFNAQVQGEAASPGTYNIIGQTGPIYGIQTIPIRITILEP
jgi:hypothetical protein